VPRAVVGRRGATRAGLALSIACAALIAAPAAQADTVWICKPGQADDLCAGTIQGSTLPPPGESPEPLGYTRPKRRPIDCFYLYPTQSEQPGPNSNLDKDPPIRRVVVQQARMFSSLCKVYAPMYRQVTLNGNQAAYNPSVETAYRSARAAFRDFLQNHNRNRGFIMIGHSQGSAHTARLIAELIDPNPRLRKRFVGAIAPGANISVPIGKPVGGLFENVPACTRVGQHGCVIAFSTFNADPGPSAPFSRVDVGYWIYPEPRPDATRYEVMCTNPARLDGGNGVLEPLANLDYLVSAPPQETPAPWRGQPDYYRVSCKRQGGAHWLHLSKLNLSGDARPDLGSFLASGSNYHVPEVNLAEGNLLTIARLQARSFAAKQASLRQRLRRLNAKVRKARRHRAADRRAVKRLSTRLRRAETRELRRELRQRLRSRRRHAARDGARIRSLRKRISAVERQLV
jgi:hypothetical protein